MPTPKPPRAGKAATWSMIAVGFVGGFEGLRTQAYKDPIGIPTVCFGETAGVKMGDHYTVEQCNAMLENRLEHFAAAVRGCVVPELPPARMAATVSLFYNIGNGAGCRSSVVRLLNAGETRAACDAFMKWNKAGGITFPGLTRRREAERQLCLEGL